MSASVQVRGLADFRKAIKQVDGDLPKALRVALNQSSGLIIDDARPRVPSKSGRARGSVKAKSTQKRSRVAGGGGRAPYYPWLDFGGRVGRDRSVSRPWRPQGRYIYNAFFDNRNRYAELLQESLLEVAEQAGLGVEHV